MTRDPYRVRKIFNMDSISLWMGAAPNNFPLKEVAEEAVDISEITKRIVVFSYEDCVLCADSSLQDPVGNVLKMFEVERTKKNK